MGRLIFIPIVNCDFHQNNEYNKHKTSTPTRDSQTQTHTHTHKTSRVQQPCRAALIISFFVGQIELCMHLKT